MSAMDEIPSQPTMMNLMIKMITTRPIRPPAIPPTIPPTLVAELARGDEVLLATEFAVEGDASKVVGVVSCTLLEVTGAAVAYTARQRGHEHTI